MTYDVFGGTLNLAQLQFVDDVTYSRNCKTWSKWLVTHQRTVPVTKFAVYDYLVMLLLLYKFEFLTNFGK